MPSTFQISTKIGVFGQSMLLSHYNLGTSGSQRPRIMLGKTSTALKSLSPLLQNLIKMVEGLDREGLWRDTSLPTHDYTLLKQYSNS